MSLQYTGGTQLIDPIALLRRAEIKEGDIVAEFGCGTSGHLVFPAAHLVGPKGKVYAVDILKSVLQSIESRRKVEGADNVETLWADVERAGALRIADKTVDMVVLLHILAQVRQRAGMLAEALRIMKPGGTLLVCDWLKTASPLGPPVEARIDGAAVTALARAAGFSCEAAFDVGPYHFGMVCREKS